MDEIICYLNQHCEIKKIALLIDEDIKYDFLQIFFTNVPCDEIVLLGNLPESKIEYFKDRLRIDRNAQTFSMPAHIVYRNYLEFQGIDDTSWALCAEHVPPEILLEVSEWKPDYLLASIEEGYVTAFKIWEKYKSTTQYIQIKTLRKDKEPQVLLWEKDPDNEIELSVIFPMYNVASYLDTCISSVTEWKAPYVEFLFVNDGSPDNSRGIVLEWAEKDSRIKLLDKENGGCASAREYGMEHAKGRYIGFIDPDDFIDESMFRKLLRSAMTGSYDISYCGYNEYYENTKETKRADDTLGWPYSDGTADQKCIYALIAYCRVAIWRGIYKTEMLKKNNIHFYTDLRRFDDLPFKVETFAAAKSVISIPEYLYYYRLARPGQDVSADDERLYVHFDIFNYLNKSIKQFNNQELIDQLQMCKIQTHLYALSKIRPEFIKEYIRQAKLDLDSTGEIERTYRLAKKRIGKEKAELYKKIVKEKY